jgi:UDP-N-acetylglucosamine 1-carboxyvinyltransferase
VPAPSDPTVPPIVIRRSEPLHGTVRIVGAKNSVLKLMAAALLAEGTTELTNVPAIADVVTMGELVAALGLRVEASPGVLRLHRPAELSPVAPYELVERIRASIVVLGPLLATCGRARVSMPGGDDFGARPIDLHVRGLEALGAEFTLRHGELDAVAPYGLHGADITLEFPSVGATENILMAAVLAQGRTVLDNAAREPEIGDLCRFLVGMGARIEGIGSPTLEITGVPAGTLRPTTHHVVPDRLEAATYAAAAAITGGELFLADARAEHMRMLLDKLRDMGILVEEAGDGSGFWVKGPARLRSVDVATLPYPGIATDYKPFLIALLAVADGVGIVTENLFAGRFRYVEELLRMGAQIRTDAHHAVVRGVPRLSGADVRCHDIRAGACLVVAGLAAEGTTVVHDCHHVERGYEAIVDKLRAVGADVTRG